MRKKRIVTIGGGTGTFVVLSGLKEYKDKLDISAIVTVADDGGSTGKLRDEFGYLPVGDVRMALVALSEESELLRELFLYRFSKGEMKGHNFGNLFLTAMTDIMGSDRDAIEFTANILRVDGKVIPVSDSDIRLVAEYEDGSMLVGQHVIDVPPYDKKITKLSLDKEAACSENAKESIDNADLIVLGPGDLYTSTLSNIVIGGVAESIRESKGKLVYIMNLFTKHGQTTGFSAKNYISELENYIGRKPNYILINNKELPNDIIVKYEEEKGFPVVDDLDDAVRVDLLSVTGSVKAEGDSIKRSLIRHDSHKLAAELIKLI